MDLNLLNIDFLIPVTNTPLEKLLPLRAKKVGLEKLLQQ